VYLIQHVITFVSYLQQVCGVGNMYNLSAVTKGNNSFKKVKNHFKIKSGMCQWSINVKLIYIIHII